MSPHTRYPPDDPREWLNRARSNLARARGAKNMEAVYLEDVCFDAQQAAEKAIKAVLLSRKVDFPKVHDIAELLTLASQQALALPDEVAEAAALTHYAVEGRYPANHEPATAEDCHAAIACAEAVLRWATGLVQGKP